MSGLAVTKRAAVLPASIVIAFLIAAALGMGQSSANKPVQGSSGDVVQADIEAGKSVFQGSGGCLSCHRVGAVGSVVGPNLSDVGARLTRGELRQSLLSPGNSDEPAHRLYELVTSEGRTLRGKLLNQDPFSVQMLDDRGELVAFSRKEIRSVRSIDPPRMPSYENKLTSTQIDHLVAYLASLRAPRSE